VHNGLESTPDPEAAINYLQQLRESYEAGPLGEGRDNTT
jgi:hypothetical protein